MKKLLAIIVLLAASTVGAQGIPEWMVGDYVGEAGPIDVQMKLVDFNTPWSIPPMPARQVLFGELSFHGESGADLDVTEMASMWCGTPHGCYAYNVKPISMNQWFPWFEFYHAYIWVGGSSDSTPMFSSLSIDLMSSSGYWATGQFLLSGFDWAVHPNAFYSLYLVEPRAIPIVSIPLAELR